MNECLIVIEILIRRKKKKNETLNEIYELLFYQYAKYIY